MNESSQLVWLKIQQGKQNARSSRGLYSNHLKFWYQVLWKWRPLVLGKVHSLGWLGPNPCSNEFLACLTPREGSRQHCKFCAWESLSLVPELVLGVWRFLNFRIWFSWTWLMPFRAWGGIEVRKEPFHHTVTQRLRERSPTDWQQPACLQLKVGGALSMGVASNGFCL